MYTTKIIQSQALNPLLLRFRALHAEVHKHPTPPRPPVPSCPILSHPVPSCPAHPGPNEMVSGSQCWKSWQVTWKTQTSSSPWIKHRQSYRL